MFNSSTPERNAPRYIFDLTRYYKIWFSLNPNEFLGIENELRLIRERENNPNIVLSLIYSAQCLNETARNGLIKFCTTYKINPVALESLGDTITDDQDKILYAHALEELAQVRAKTGGNVGSASDLTRIIKPIIEQYGIYSDLDVACNLSQLNANFIDIRGPILLPFEFYPIGTNELIPSPNSDTLAFSIVSNADSKNLSADALTALCALQKQVIKNYSTPFTWTNISNGSAAKELSIYPELPDFLNRFQTKYPTNPSIYNFRTFLAEEPELPIHDKQPFSLKNFLIKISVINLAGPGTYLHLFTPKLSKSFSAFPMKMNPTKAEWHPLFKYAELCSFGFYTVLDNLVKSNNSIYASLISASQGKTNTSEQAWSLSGAKNRIARNDTLIKSTKIIQKNWKHSLFNGNFIYAKSLQICKNTPILQAIKEKNYSLALKRASSVGHLRVVELIVQFHHQKRISFDINEASSNGNTALDWINLNQATTATGKANKQRIIEILKQEGALTAAELISNSKDKTN
ncbi:MAG: glycosyltransferase family 88 protein [Legionella sp.]|jgi:hypothetical protein